MKDPSTVEFLNEIHQCIASPQSTSQATHLLKHYHNFFGSFELQPSLYRHKLYNSSFLIDAIQYHNVPVVKFLLSLGVDVNFKHLTTHQTAIWTLCATHHTENTVILLHILLPHINLEHYSKDFSTSLLYATLSISSEFSQYTVQALDVLLKAYHTFYLKTSPEATLLTNDNSSTTTPSSPSDPKPNSASYPQFNLPPKLLTGDVSISYNSLPAALQQFNNSQHESTSPPPNFQNNVIQMSLFHLMFFNSAQIYFSFWCKQIIQLLLPYYWFFITQQPYETIYLNVFFFEQWVVNGLLSSHLCTVESIMYIFGLDFYHLPQAVTNKGLFDEKPTNLHLPAPTMISTSTHLEHPLLVNGKMPYFDYIYTFLEHLPMLHQYQASVQSGQHHGHVVYKGNFDSFTILETLLSLPTVNIHNWPWEEDDQSEPNHNHPVFDHTQRSQNNNNNNNDDSSAKSSTKGQLTSLYQSTGTASGTVSNLSLDSIAQHQHYPKLTRYEFAQLIWVLFYTHPKPTNTFIVNKIFLLLFKSTFHPHLYPSHPTALTPLISTQFKSVLPLNENLYDPEGIYAYGSVLSAFSSSNYPFSKDLFLFILQNITHIDPDYTKQVPFSYRAVLHMSYLQATQATTTCNTVLDSNGTQLDPNVAFAPDTVLSQLHLNRDLSLIRKYSTFYPLRGFFHHFLKFGIRVFSKYDQTCVDFIKYIYQWMFYPFFYSTTLHQNYVPQYSHLAQYTTPNLQIPTSNNSFLDHTFAELQLTAILNDILANTIISQYDSTQLIEYIFQLFTKDFPKVSTTIFPTLFFHQFLTSTPNFHGLSLVYNLYTKYQTTGNNCATYDKARILKACAAHVQSAIFNIPQHNTMQLFDNIFGFKKTKDAIFASNEEDLSSSQTSSPTPAKGAGSSGNKSYDFISNVMHGFVQEFCKAIVTNKSQQNSEASSEDSNEPSHATLFPRSGALAAFFLNGTSENPYANPFLYEASTEMLLRSLFSELLRFYKTKRTLTGNVMPFLVFMFRTVVKQNTFTFHYQPNRPYREYLYKYDEDFFASLMMGTGSTTPTPGSPAASNDAPTGRRRGNVVTGPAPGMPQGIGGGNKRNTTAPASPSAVGSDIKPFSLMPSSGRSKMSVLPSQRPKLVKQPCWSHYHHFASRLQQHHSNSTPNQVNLSNHKPSLKDGASTKLTSKSTTEASPQKPTSPTAQQRAYQPVGSSTMGLNIRFVNKPKQMSSITQPEADGLEIDPDKGDDAFPDPPSSPLNASNADTPSSPSAKPRKTLKASGLQQSIDGSSGLRTTGQIGLVNGTLQPLVYPDDQIFVPLRCNSASSITPTTPPLVAHDDRFAFNHVYLHNYSLLRRNLFMTNIFDTNLIELEADKQQNQQNSSQGPTKVVLSQGEYEKSRKSFIKSNTRRFELDVSGEVFERYQHYAIDLLSSFTVHLLTTNTYNATYGTVAMYGGKSPIVTAHGPGASPVIYALDEKNISGGKPKGVVSPTLTPLQPTPQRSNQSGKSPASSSTGVDIPSPTLLPLPSHQNRNGGGGFGLLQPSPLVSNVSTSSFPPPLTLSPQQPNAAAGPSTSPSSTAPLSQFITSKLHFLPYLNHPIFPSGHIYLDVTHLFLHEVTLSTVALIRRLIENTMKSPHLITLITSPPESFKIFTKRSAHQAAPSTTPSEHCLPQTDTDNPRNLLNHHHFGSYLYHINIRSSYVPYFTSPIDMTAINLNSNHFSSQQSPSLSPLTPPSLSPQSSEATASLQNTSASDPFHMHLPPFLSLLWLGAPNTLTIDNSTTPHAFPSGASIQAANTLPLHQTTNSLLSNTHPNLILTHNRPGYKVTANDEFITAFKLLLEYWVTLMYQRYHWETGETSRTTTNKVDTAAPPAALLDTFTVQQQLLQSLFSPYIIPVAPQFNNPSSGSTSPTTPHQTQISKLFPTLQPQPLAQTPSQTGKGEKDNQPPLPPIFHTLPILFLFFSRFNPHTVSPQLIDLFNTLISNLCVPLATADLAYLSSSPSQSNHVHQLGQHDHSHSSMQPIDYAPKTANEQSYANHRALNDGAAQNVDAAQNRSILGSLKYSLFRSKEDKTAKKPPKVDNPTPVTKGKDEEEKESDVLLTPLNIISTSSIQHTHTMPLISIHHYNTAYGQSEPHGGVEGTKKQNSFAAASAGQKKLLSNYISMLESVLFTEQRHHYHLFLTQQQGRYHTNSLLPLHPTTKEPLVNSYVSFNTFRLVNLFSFDYYTLLHMILLPYSHPLKHAILTQSLYKMDLPTTPLPSPSVPSSLYIPANTNWLLNTTRHTEFSPPQLKAANPALQPAPLQNQPKIEKPITYHDSRNTLASLQRQNRIIILPLSTLTPSNHHHATQFTFTPQLFTLLSLFNAYGFDWNTNILTALPNHFTSSNITQFLDSNLGSSELNGKNSGIGSATMNIMTTFATQKQSLLAAYTNILSSYLPPIFALQSYFQTNSLLVSFIAMLCGLQRYLSHTALHSSGLGVMKGGHFSTKQPLTAWSYFGKKGQKVDQVEAPVNDDSELKSNPGQTGVNQLSTPFYKTNTKLDATAPKKPAKHKPILLTPYDLQHFSIEPYQFGSAGGGNGLSNDHRKADLVPIMQTLFSHGNYSSSDITGNSTSNTNSGNKSTFSLDFHGSTNQPTLFASSYPVLTALYINQYISSSALTGVLLNANDTSLNNSDKKEVSFSQYQFYTLLSLHLLRTDLSWDNNWLHLLALYIQNGAIINYKHLYSSNNRSLTVPPQVTPSVKLDSLYTNDILLHYLTGHQYKHSRHLAWYKGLLLLLSSGCNVLYFKRNADSSLNDLTAPIYTHTCKKSQLPSHPQIIHQIESQFFAQELQASTAQISESPAKLSAKSNLASPSKPSSPPVLSKTLSSASTTSSGSQTTLSSNLSHHGMHYIPDFHRIFQLVQFYHFQGVLQWNNKYTNITTSLLFHPRVEMRKYWLEPFKAFYESIYSPWAQLQHYKLVQNPNNKKDSISAIKIALLNTFPTTAQNPTTQPHIIIDDHFIPQQIQKQMLIHKLLFSHDLVFAFTSRSMYSIAEQIKILSYFSTLPFSTFFTLFQQINTLLTTYHREKSVIPLNQNTALHHSLVGIGVCLERSLVQLNSFPNVVPVSQYTEVFEQDSDRDIHAQALGKALFVVDKKNAQPGSKPPINPSAVVKLNVGDIPIHPTIQYISTLGSAATAVNMIAAPVQASTSSSSSSSFSSGGLQKSGSNLSSLFEAPTEDELSSGTQRVYVPDGTFGLFWYIMNNCYPHSQYLSTSYILQHDFNQSNSISSQELQGDPDDCNGVETSTLRQPADLSHLIHDFVSFMDSIIQIYNQTNPASSPTTYFSNTTQLNQNLLSHALLRRWPEQVLFALVHYLGLDNAVEHYDFNGFNLHDYLLYLHIDTYASNFVSFIMHYYATNHQDKQQSLEEKFSTNPVKSSATITPNVAQTGPESTPGIPQQPQAAPQPSIKPIVEEEDDVPPPPPPGSIASPPSQLQDTPTYAFRQLPDSSDDDEAPAPLPPKKSTANRGEPRTASGSIQIEHSLPPRPSIFVPDPVVVPKQIQRQITAEPSPSGFQRPVLSRDVSVDNSKSTTPEPSHGIRDFHQDNDDDDDCPPPPPP